MCFERQSPFGRDVKLRVQAYFAERGLSPYATSGLWLTAAAIMVWWVTAWALLVFWASSWVTAIPLAIAVGLGMVGVGFCIQHDGGHRAWSKRSGINRMMAYSLDLLGGSSYVWDYKHDKLHHTYTNIDGFDDDIDTGGLLRLSPGQPHAFYHRLQPLYAWALYAVMAIKWQLWDDYLNVIFGRIGDNPIPRPRGWELVGFIFGKAFTLSWAVVIPLLVRPEPVWVILALFALALGTTGLLLGTVFQLAHCVNETTFFARGAPIRLSWAEHQVVTTCDFAVTSRLVTVLTGGLNCQVVHHLFPRVSHVHYPTLAAIVKATAAEHGVPYAANPSFFTALSSHARFLHRMGRGDCAA